MPICLKFNIDRHCYEILMIRCEYMQRMRISLWPNVDRCAQKNMQYQSSLWWWFSSTSWYWNIDDIIAIFNCSSIMFVRTLVFFHRFAMCVCANMSVKQEVCRCYFINTNRSCKENANDVQVHIGFLSCVSGLNHFVLFGVCACYSNPKSTNMNSNCVCFFMPCAYSIE